MLIIESLTDGVFNSTGDSLKLQQIIEYIDSEFESLIIVDINVKVNLPPPAQ